MHDQKTAQLSSKIFKNLAIENRIGIMDPEFKQVNKVAELYFSLPNSHDQEEILIRFTNLFGPKFIHLHPKHELDHCVKQLYKLYKGKNRMDTRHIDAYLIPACESYQKFTGVSIESLVMEEEF